MKRLSRLPRVNQVDYFRRPEGNLASVLGRAIADHRSQYPDDALNPLHMAISAWVGLATDVPNGGLTQFFYNHRGDEGVDSLATLLDGLDLPKPATIIREAAAIYREHRASFDVLNPWDGLFGSIQPLERLDKPLMRFMLRGHRAIDVWITENIHELATDESGERIDPKFTGIVDSRDPAGWLKEMLDVQRGKPHGRYVEYFDDGSIRDQLFYKAGKVDGEVWPNGNIKCKRSTRIGIQTIEWFYESGHIQKRYVKDRAGNILEPILLYHPNGQLAQKLSVTSVNGKGRWEKFFEDGTPQLDAEYLARDNLVVQNAWNANSVQVVKDGTGTFYEDSESIWTEFDIFFRSDWTQISSLRNGVKNGKAETYNENVLWSINHYKDGRLDGESTTYWKNGRIRSVEMFQDGTPVSTIDFPQFDIAVPAVVMRVEANERMYTAWRHIRVDEYPRPLNADEIQTQLVVPDFLREIHERNLAGNLRNRYEDCNTFNDGITYLLNVDLDGAVKAIRPGGSGVCSIGHWNTYPAVLRGLRFSPARIRGRAIECRVAVSVDHTFVEGKG